MKNPEYTTNNERNWPHTLWQALERVASLSSTTRKEKNVTPKNEHAMTDGIPEEGIKEALRADPSLSIETIEWAKEIADSCSSPEEVLERLDQDYKENADYYDMASV